MLVPSHRSCSSMTQRFNIQVGRIPMMCLIHFLLQLLTFAFPPIRLISPTYSTPYWTPALHLQRRAIACISRCSLILRLSFYSLLIPAWQLPAFYCSVIYPSFHPQLFKHCCRGLFDSVRKMANATSLIGAVLAICASFRLSASRLHYR